MGVLIFQKITEVMRTVDAIGKNRDNRAQGFKFRGIDDVMNELHPLMSKVGIFVVPEVLEERREERATKSGGVSIYVILKIKYSFFAEDGSSVSAVMIGEAMDTGDKASNKAQSIALKYACLQVFAIPTEDDKDPDGTSHELKPKQSSVEMPKSQIVAPTRPAAAPKTKREALGQYVLRAAVWVDGENCKGKRLIDLDMHGLANTLGRFRDKQTSGTQFSGPLLDDMLALSGYLDACETPPPHFQEEPWPE